jgi:hypothetical protein
VTEERRFGCEEGDAEAMRVADAACEAIREKIRLAAEAAKARELV